VLAISIGFGAVLLVFSEVLPKNIGVAHRRALQPYVVYPIAWLRRVLSPSPGSARSSCGPSSGRRQGSTARSEEIILLAERGAQEGTLSKSESSIIANALSLDNVRVSEIMTPRTVVTGAQPLAVGRRGLQGAPHPALRQDAGLRQEPGRHRGDRAQPRPAQGQGHDQDAGLVEQFMQEAQFIPETATVANALQVCLKTHNKLLVVVDEFGATAGVVTMEDVIEHLLGREIFDKDDVAVDMRELARTKLQKQDRAGAL
jgi:CBS domain containing-hemolysin-like protein